ncbi:MAG: CCA tRNA nucleotidyltransferase [Rikenellaceae bacterium]|nr:CCA tRNA nucleotidyltransferase [Rikenellaceae bacterium]
MRYQEAVKDPVFRKIGEVADKNNVRVFVIGGYVRDFFLNRPCKDIDIVVDGDGIGLANSVGREFGTKVTVFKTFGTAMLRYKGLELEFVGARKESYNFLSRKPVVEKGSIEDDQHRRDFTINALALSLNKETFGELSDPFDGIADLERLIIRTPGDPDITYSDDPLRMIRAIRFATQLGFDIESGSFQAIERNKERLKIISQERIITEINKIICSEVPSIGFDLLDKTGLLKIIFPEMSKLKGVEINNGRGHKDNFIHTLKVVDNISKVSDNLWLRWAALLHDIGKPKTKVYDAVHGWTFHGHEVAGSKMVPGIFRHLRLPMNEKMKYVQKLVFLHMRPIILAEETVTDSAVRRLLFDAGDDIEDLMILCEADITSGIEAKVKRYLKNFALVRKKLREIEEKDKIRNFQPPVTGEMIMERYGIGPSREVGIIKDRIKNAILDGEISNDYAQAVELMEKIASEILHGKK